MAFADLNNEKLPMKKVALHTLGCRLNMSETGSIAQGFTDRGYEIVPFGEQADVVFVNTCTVTDQADSTCRQLIRKAHRSSPEGKIVVAGCYAQMDPETIKNMQGVDLVLGTTEKYKVFDYLEEEASQIVRTDKTIEFYGAATTPSDSHTRAFLKIQDGCNYVCSFCIIPQARGRSRALGVEAALGQARSLVAQGFREVVLTGVNIGEYETATGEKLVDLVRGLFAIDGLERLRLSSVEPNTLTPELLEAFQSSPKFLDHFHIPLQSGDDQILKSMRRKYTVAQYEQVIERVLRAFPDAGIGADIIVGYPGETKEQFQNTFDLVRHLPLTHFHVFPYSKRKNTTAAKLEDQIPYATKKERVKTLLMLGDAKLAMFSEDQVGKESLVLFEKRGKDGLFTGYTSNYVQVRVSSEQELNNEIRRVRLTHYEQGRLFGKLI